MEDKPVAPAHLEEKVRAFHLGKIMAAMADHFRGHNVTVSVKIEIDGFDFYCINSFEDGPGHGGKGAA